MVPSLIIVGDDLIFSSRISATARSIGAHLRSVRTVEAALAQSEQAPADCVIVDLALPGLQLTALVEGLSNLGHRPLIVAYGSHVDTAGLKAAQEAGCDLVLTRSQFVEQLETGLPEWFDNTPGR